MLNMLNFFGFLELTGLSSLSVPKTPKRFNMLNISVVSLNCSHQSPPSSTLPCRKQNLLPTGEILNMVGFGGKNVSETAEMLNMLNFWGFLELTGRSYQKNQKHQKV